jgi:hypothetical protein
MMNLDIYKSFDPYGSGASRAPFSRLLLPGQVKRVESVQVDVQVRDYDEATPLDPRFPTAGPRTGQLPVGTLLDCYL